MLFTVKELSPSLWPDLERLFGATGACGGCWCQAWRVPRGGKAYQAIQGEPAHQMLHEQVLSGHAKGVLAYHGLESVGWCTFGPRSDFPRLETVKAYARADLEGVWSIPCFYIHRTARGQGVSKALLHAAVEACRRQGARIVEGYPVTPTKTGEKLPAAFSWTGPLSIFLSEGFQVVQSISASKPLVRKVLES